MTRYLTNPDSRWTANRVAQGFELSAEVRDLARRIVADPARYNASNYLGHTCLVIVREAHPYEWDRTVPSLQAVYGLALGPADSVYLEEHRVWKKVKEDWEEPGFTDYRGGCTQLVREPNGLIDERALSDSAQTSERDHVVRDDILGIVGPYYGLRRGVQDVVDLVDDPGVLSASNDRYFHGPDAVGHATELMQHGHQFTHPALREWHAANTVAQPV